MAERVFAMLLLLSSSLGVPQTQPLAPRSLQISPAATLRTIQDAADRLSFQLPVDWPVSTRDRELSTFHHEARTSPRKSRLRFVAAMPENPFPESTFSGAHFYLSVTQGQTEAQCRSQAPQTTANRSALAPRSQIDDRPANHGYDQSGSICTQFRDEVYTLRRNGACLRFDLAMNNFCGGEVSGVRDLTPEQIGAIQARLKAILASVRFGR